ATFSFSNNVVNSAMLIGIGTTYSETGSDSAGTTKAGAGKSLATLRTQATWTTVLGWSSDIWDFSGLAQNKWPTLK
ncbi:MAG: hypothetical protein LBG79_03770, partial [Spirochaetaceae bacterium]|nr:hypothetical protein [Spirochaetaceae bacterium]